jgi:hypothetical protein
MVSAPGFRNHPSSDIDRGVRFRANRFNFILHLDVFVGVDQANFCIGRIADEFSDRVFTDLLFIAN